MNEKLEISNNKSRILENIKRSILDNSVMYFTIQYNNVLIKVFQLGIEQRIGSGTGAMLLPLMFPQ